MNELDSQKELIESKDWDFLVILDACRYDYFKKIYKDYLEGNLKRVRSPGSHTSEWCRKVFPEKYKDLVFVSGNPRINSIMEINNFDGSSHFFEVVDVWDWGWNDKVGTVLPETVNEAAIKARKRFSEKRLVVHYMQPHFPYLSYPTDNSGVSGNPINHQELKVENKALLNQIRGWLGHKLENIIGVDSMIRFRKLVGLRPVSVMRSVVREIGKDGLRKAYLDNLHQVLKSVLNLVERFQGNFVITSDHGEMLGERGNYGHGSENKKIEENRVLVEVPWLEIEAK